MAFSLAAHHYLGKLSKPQISTMLIWCISMSLMIPKNIDEGSGLIEGLLAASDPDCVGSFKS